MSATAEHGASLQQYEEWYGKLPIDGLLAGSFGQLLQTHEVALAEGEEPDDLLGLYALAVSTGEQVLGQVEEMDQKKANEQAALLLRQYFGMPKAGSKVEELSWPVAIELLGKELRAREAAQEQMETVAHSVEAFIEQFCLKLLSEFERRLQKAQADKEAYLLSKQQTQAIKAEGGLSDRVNQFKGGVVQVYDSRLRTFDDQITHYDRAIQLWSVKLMVFMSSQIEIKNRLLSHSLIEASLDPNLAK